ncbi:MAG TPA: hypothetical protein VEA99_06400 [Gemmatimonadaceae bacterium]|nr:hypothetical protein [Gemmatimonadaceae bacterium]
MPVKFDGIAGPAAMKMTAAYNALPQYVDRCVLALTPGHIDWARYRTWFDAAGNTNPANVQLVRSVFQTVQQWLRTKTITFANVGGSSVDLAIPGLCAYVLAPTHHMRSGGGLGGTAFGGVDHVGSGVRVLIPPRVAANSTELLLTMFHELCHKVGFRVVDTPPSPYDEAACRQKAQTQPQLAITNAENYTFFLKELNGL